MPPALCERGFHTKGARADRFFLLEVRTETGEELPVNRFNLFQQTPVRTFTRPERRIIEGARFLQRNFASSTNRLG